MYFKRALNLLHPKNNIQLYNLYVHTEVVNAVSMQRRAE